MGKVEGLPEPFEPFTVITGEEVMIQEKIDLFFRGILDFLGYDERARKAFVNIEIRNLAFNGPQVRASDDMIHWLIIGNYCVASVINRRDEFNYVEVLSACYLTPERVKRLREGIDI